jgi:hypothetical protein
MYATDGHITAGISEKDIPSRTITINSVSGIYALPISGMFTKTNSPGGRYVTTRNKGKRIIVPTIIKRDLFPTLSTHKPNRGVAIIADNGRRLLRIPAASLSSP